MNEMQENMAVRPENRAKAKRVGRRAKIKVGGMLGLPSDLPQSVANEPHEVVARYRQQRDQAACFLADGSKSLVEIAKTVGVSEMTLARWRKDHEFVAKVQQYQAEWRERVKRDGIADRLRRVEGQVRRHRKLERIIDARAEASAGEANPAPGADTGLLVKRLKSVGYGDSAQIIEEWSIDDAALKEMRGLEEAVAIELGQRVTRVETSHRDIGEEELVALLESQLAALPADQRAELQVEASQLKVSVAVSPQSQQPDQPANTPCQA